MNRYLSFYIILTGAVFMGVLQSNRVHSQEFSGWTTDHHYFITVHVENGEIIQISTSTPSPGEENIYIGPGLIDTQVNGYHGVSFSEKDLTVEKIETVAQALWEEGVTTFFPTLITSNPETIRQNLAILSEAARKPLLDHTMPGYFLEGPYISPIDGFRGAHDLDWVRKPDWDEFLRFIQASGNRIIQIGLAPELEGSQEFIRNCSLRGINVALAHHNGSPAEIEEAVRNGARVSTHLGNGCANLIHRHNNPLWPQLANDRITPSIIADGHHLNAEELKVFYSVKGQDHIFLVSDATKLAGMPPGTYEWDGKKVVMTEEGMLQMPEQQVLAGASFPVRTGVMNMVKLVDIPLDKAYGLASRNPARVYHMEDRGQLITGRSADLILFTIEDGQMNILKTVVKGEVVFEK